MHSIIMSAAFANISVQDAAILHKAYAPAAVPTKTSPPISQSTEKSQILYHDSVTHSLKKSSSIDRDSFDSIDQQKWSQKQHITAWSRLAQKMRKLLAIDHKGPIGQ